MERSIGTTRDYRSDAGKLDSDAPWTIADIWVRVPGDRVRSVGVLGAARQRLGEEVIGYAHSIKTHALVRLGELLAVMPKAKGRGGRTSKLEGSRAVPSNSPPTLAEMGVDKKTSSVAQQLATLDAPTRDAIAKREKTFSQRTRHRGVVVAGTL